MYEKKCSEERGVQIWTYGSNLRKKGKVQNFFEDRENFLTSWTGLKVRIIEISQEPQDTRSKDLSEQEHKWRKVKHIHHANKPMKKHGSA